jgi:resuscitation-promoting factor RpfB
MGALMAGFLLLQFGMTSNTPAVSQLAAARGADHAANRGSGRTRLDDQAITNALVAASQVTTTTVAPTTTTTAAPTTTVPPTTSTTAAHKAAAPKPAVALTVATTPPPPPPSGDTGVTGNDVWAQLAMCESGGRNYSTGPYYGYFQFSPGTWASLGGTGLPSSATYAQQKQLAIALQARSGWAQWPVCSKTIGAA